jgi:hypothetical protein
MIRGQPVANPQTQQKLRSESRARLQKFQLAVVLTVPPQTEGRGFLPRVLSGGSAAGSGGSLPEKLYRSSSPRRNS